MGTPGKIVEDKQQAILVPDGKDEKGNPKWKRSKANLSGMMTIDEPTLDYYRQLDAEKKKAAQGTGP